MMDDDRETLDRALNLFGDDDSGAFISGDAQEIGLRAQISREVDRAWAQAVNLNWAWITQDFWNLATIVDRLEWTRARSLADPGLAARWMYYTAVDIQVMHTEIRSVLDYVARIVAASCRKPGEVPGTFRKLLEWIKVNAARIPPDLRELVLRQEHWAREVRGVRDLLVHRGGMAIVFAGPKEGILFQVYDERLHKAVVVEAPLLYNENVAYFDRYAALHLARLMVFLEALGALLRARIPGDLVLNGRSHGVGYGTLRSWIQRLRALL